MEYNYHIEKYSLSGYHMYSRFITESEWGNKGMAEDYLEKYWLPNDEYIIKWKPIQDRIFVNQEFGFPKLIFSKDYDIIALKGGFLFEKSDYDQLQECLVSLGDKHFVIAENTFGNKLDEPPFRLKYPTGTSWKELMSGNFISSILFEMFHKEYFIYSESGIWGKYAAIEYKNPIDILGFKPEYKSNFRIQCMQSQKDWEEINECLPLIYRAILK